MPGRRVGRVLTVGAKPLLHQPDLDDLGLVYLLGELEQVWPGAVGRRHSGHVNGLGVVGDHSLHEANVRLGEHGTGWDLDRGHRHGMSRRLVLGGFRRRLILGLARGAERQGCRQNGDSWKKLWHVGLDDTGGASYLIERKGTNRRCGVAGQSAVSRDVIVQSRSRWTNVRGENTVDAEHSSDVLGARSSSGTRITPAGKVIMMKWSGRA